MDHCDECGFEYDSVSVDELPDALRGLSRRYRAPLTRFLPGEDGDALVRAHPIEGAWSALEYACHVRDVLAVQRGRLELAMQQDTPRFEPMGRDERVVNDRYNEQSPAEVVDQLDENARALGDAFEALSDEQLERTGIYNWPEPAERTMTWLGRHTVHEGAHHLLDIGRVLRAARGR